MHSLKFKRSVQGDMKRVGKEAARKILQAIRKDLLPDPRTGKQLKGKEGILWSYRVGDYRVIYTFNDKELYVLLIRIGQRKDVYRGV